MYRLYATSDDKKSTKRTKASKSEIKAKKIPKTAKAKNKSTKAVNNVSTESVETHDELPRKSTVSVGTQFELRAQSLLRERFSMMLERSAGPGDGGLDLVGWWWLPRDPTPSSTEKQDDSDEVSASDRWRIRVLAQCKAEKKGFGPNYVREMEGVLHRLLFPHDTLPTLAPSDEKAETQTYTPKPIPTLALLVSLSPFTNKAVARAMSSPIPFLLLHLPKESDPSAGEIPEDEPTPSLLWNPALGSEKGLMGGKLEVRWERGDAGAQPVLWWDGKPFPRLVPVS